MNDFSAQSHVEIGRVDVAGLEERADLLQKQQELIDVLRKHDQISSLTIVAMQRRIEELEKIFQLAARKAAYKDRDRLNLIMQLRRKLSGEVVPKDREKEISPLAKPERMTEEEWVKYKESLVFGYLAGGASMPAIRKKTGFSTHKCEKIRDNICKKKSVNPDELSSFFKPLSVWDFEVIIPAELDQPTCDFIKDVATSSLKYGDNSFYKYGKKEMQRIADLFGVGKGFDQLTAFYQRNRIIFIHNNIIYDRAQAQPKKHADPKRNDGLPKMTVDEVTP